MTTFKFWGKIVYVTLALLVLILELYVGGAFLMGQTGDFYPIVGALMLTSIVAVFMVWTEWIAKMSAERTGDSK